MGKRVTTGESVAELEMKELLAWMDNTTKKEFISYESATKLIEAGYKLVDKVKELRISRDNWRNKYEALKGD